MKPETRERRARYARERRAQWHETQARRDPWPEDAEEQAERRARALAKLPKVRRVAPQPDPRAALPRGRDDGGTTQ